jgi:predicted metal-binding transcription factor (methanogenesis marker protein 9)
MATTEIYINKISDNEWESIKEKLASYIIGTKINKSARVLVVPVKEVDWVLQIITNVTQVSDIKLQKCDE